MDNIEFATFKPIINLTDDTKERLRDYYTTNNLTPSNDYMKNYLGLSSTVDPPILSLSLSKSTNNTLDVKKLFGDKISTPSETEYNNVSVPDNVKNLDKVKEAIKYFVGSGLTKAQAAGIVGNLHAESELQTNIPGDNGQAYGIAQWHPDRQATFKKIIGKDIRNSTFSDQLKFVNWELHNSENEVLQAILKTTTPKEASKAFFKFERFKGFNTPEGGQSGRTRQQFSENFFNIS